MHKCHILKLIKSMYLDIKIFNCATVILQPETPLLLQVRLRPSNRSTYIRQSIIKLEQLGKVVEEDETKK